jgi:hypothetical protein
MISVNFVTHSKKNIVDPNIMIQGVKSQVKGRGP